MANQAIIQIMATAILTTILIRLIARIKQRRSSQQSANKRPLLSATQEANVADNEKHLIVLPPLIDSKLLRIEYILLILSLMASFLAKHVFRSSKIANVLNILFIFVLVSSTITVIVTIVLSIWLARYRKSK